MQHVVIHLPLLNPCQIPTLSSFPLVAQNHGAVVLALQKNHKCEKCSGEHNQPRCCYVNPTTGDHDDMDMRFCADWAAAYVRYTSSLLPQGLLTPSRLPGGHP